MNGTLDHVMPLAEAGYYLTGNARAVFCLKDNNDDSFCLGGRSPSVPCFKDCECLEGHDGFLCQNCKEGWTRDSYTERCDKCPSPETVYLGLVLIWLNAISSCFFFHILTVMAIRAGQGTKSLHSVLIRLWQSWILSMNVLRVFDFSKIKMFSWGLEAARMASQSGGASGAVATAATVLANATNATIAAVNASGLNGTNASATAPVPESDAAAFSELIPFPTWFSGISKMMFSISGIPTLSSTTTIECFTELMLGPENAQDWKYIAQAIYHVTYPLFVLFWMLVLDLILVYLLYPSLEKSGVMGKPSEPKALRLWLAGRIRPHLEETCEKGGTPPELRETAIALFNEVMAGFTLGEKEMALVAHFPREGLAGLSDYYTSAEQRNKAKECMLLFSMPRFEEECEWILKPSNLHEVGLTQDLETKAADASTCWAVRNALIVCSKSMSVEEFSGALSNKHQLFTSIYRIAGSENIQIQLALIYPMFERSAMETFTFSKELSRIVWDSLSDDLNSIAVEQKEDEEGFVVSGSHEITRCLAGNNGLKNLRNMIESRSRRSATLLAIAFGKDRIQSYLSETIPSLDDLSAKQAWELILECCKTIWCTPEEMREISKQGPAETCRFIGEKAGTGFGGLLLLFLHRTNIQQHLQEKLGRSEQEFEEDWQRLCAFAYETSLNDLNALLSERTPAALVERVTRIANERESSTAGGGLGIVPKGPSAGTAVAGGVGAAGLGVAGLMQGGALGGVGTGGIMITGAFEALRMMTTQNAITQDYPVFGIFRHPKKLRKRDFLADARPLIYIGLYTMWYPTTKRLLLLVHCEAEIEVVDDVSTQYSRWMQQANFVCYTGTHLIITTLSLIGLSIWSFGLLAFLSYQIRSKKKDMNKQDVQRRFSYFTTGYELDRAYWDILVKKSDNLLTIVITYTSIAVDVKAKLLCYAALAGAYLIVHVQYQPFDDRKNVLCDRIEFLGLVVRFMIFALFEVLMIFQLDLWMAATFATIVLLSSAYFLITIITHICCEFLADLTSQSGEGVKVSEDVFDKLREKTIKDESKSMVDKLIRSAKRCAKCFGACCVEPIMRLVFQFARLASSTWHNLETDALCLMPAGIATKRIQCRTGEGKGTTCNKRLRHHVALRFFRQKDSDQREFIVTVIAGFFSHMMCHLEEERIEMGDGVLGRFLLICAALKEANTNKEIPMGIGAADKAEIIRSRIESAILHAQKFSMFEEDDNDTGGMDGIMGPGEEHHVNEQNFKDIQRLRLTGEDMNECLMILQRLDGGVVNDLLNDAKRALEKVNDEAQAATRKTREHSAPGSQVVSRMPTSKLRNAHPALENAASRDKIENGTENTSTAWKAKAMELMGIFPEGATSTDTPTSPRNGQLHGDDEGLDIAKEVSDRQALMDSNGNRDATLVIKYEQGSRTL